MILGLLKLPFRIVVGLFKVVSRLGGWFSGNFIGAIAVATIGFLLGMKYLEHKQRINDEKK